MQTNILMEPRFFIGQLSNNDETAPVEFSVGIDISGTAQICFTRFPLNVSTNFVSEHFYECGQFLLTAVSDDGTEFYCDDVVLTSLKQNLLEPVPTICPVAHYSLAKMTMRHEHSTPPVLIWRLKGFESFAPLSTTTALGIVEMVGAKDMDGKNEISGFIRVAATETPPDLEVWRKSAEDLCDHIRHVMSFAANADLAFPITEFMNSGSNEVQLYFRSQQQKSVWPPFYWLHLQGIFQCSVNNFFTPKFQVQNLYFGITWFNMHSSYREANLITAMTVLENLIDSNLSEADSLLLRKKSYEKLRKKLSAVVKEEAKTWTENVESQQAFVCELNNRFSDLKRRSLIEKLNLLAIRWGVQLEDIDPAKIREAKTARDQVVHRGHYEPGPKVAGDLHDHVLTVRELVVRFILTALQFEGHYRSFIGGQHDRELTKNVPNLAYSLATTP